MTLKINTVTGKIKKDGKVIFEAPLDQANEDWIRAARLQKQDSKEAKEKLKEMEETTIISAQEEE
jgi:hypothetical protein